MTFLHSSRRLVKVQPQTTGHSVGGAGSGTVRIRLGKEWRDTARTLGRKLMPAMVLLAAAVLGLAAVAMA